MFDADWFFDLDARLREIGLDSDAQSFDEIKENLSHRRILDADAFAENCIYVILAGGFSQRIIFVQMVRILMDCLRCFITKTK